MDASSNSVIDLQNLQYLYYERSKIWSNFFSKIKEDLTDEEISLKDFDKLFPGQNESDNDELASIEDLNCNDSKVDHKMLLEIDDTVSSRTRSKQRNCRSENNDDANDNELKDFVNQTLPILNAYSRHLKESGIENVLNTFDVEKIEDKVGTWLKNNTFKETNHTMLSNTSTEVCLPNASNSIENRQYDENHSKHIEDGSESNESLHSGDTARYIRSSRSKRNNTFKNISNNTIIKTYRTVKSKREALKEKYNCDKYNDENIYEPVFCKSRNLLRRTCCKSLEADNDTHTRHDCKTMTANNKCMEYNSEKRKALRKRLSNNSYSDTDSNATDSDCCEMNKNCGRMRLNALRRKQTGLLSPMTPHCHKHDNCIVLSSRSVNWLSPLSIHCHTPTRKHSHCNLIYPKKSIRLESECHCYHKQELCDKFQHISDTSTEEWTVDNSVRVEAKNPSECNCKFKRHAKHAVTPNKYNGLVEEMDKATKNQKNYHDAKMIAKNMKKHRKRQNSCNDPVSMESDVMPSKFRYLLPKVSSSRQAKMQMVIENDSRAEEKTFFENLDRIENSTTVSHANFFNQKPITTKYSKDDSLNKKKLQAIDEELNSNLTTCSEAAVVKRKSCNTLSSSANDTAIELCKSGNPPPAGSLAHKNQPILVYTPLKRGSSTSEGNNTSTGYINITKEHLIPIIGQQASERFFRYYAGRKQFSLNSNIYFRPPATNRLNASFVTSDSSDDLELIGECGQLYESS